MAASLWALTGTACVVLGGGGSPAVRDEVATLRPTEAGTYRMVGAERDSRTDETRRVVETYSVDPEFTRAGHDHQITRYRDSSGAERTWETTFRPTGAYRLHESAGTASWDWEPPLLTIAAPLRMGRTWVVQSTATLPDLGGTRRLTSVTARSEVVDTTTVSVGGERVFVLVIDATVSTSVTDTSRVDRKSETFVTRTAARTWFSPEHMRVVKSSGTTTVKGGGDGEEEYVVVRRVQLERL